MTETLPLPVERYFAGKNAGDLATAMSGFSPAAVVADEGHDHVGHAAIRAWMARTAAEYNDKAEVIRIASRGDEVEVQAWVSGTFPGSPVLLRFTFQLKGDAIRRLTIGS